MTHELILLDIETQRDFFQPGGSCYSPASRRASRRVGELFAWALAERIPVLSTVLRVRRNERGPLADVDHCVEGTDGERKIARSILPSRIDLGLRNTTDLPSDLLDQYQQIIVEKRHTDIFAHARIERLLTEMDVGTFVLLGAGVAHGICQAAIGLRSRGFGVILASDAVLDLDHDFAPMAARRMEAKGVIFAPAREIICPKRKPHTAPFRASMRARS